MNITTKEDAAKLVRLKASTIAEARKKLSELYAEDYNPGDIAEVTFPDGSRLIYLFEEKE